MCVWWWWGGCCGGGGMGMPPCVHRLRYTIPQWAAAAASLTPAGLEPAIPGSVGRCLIHWATGRLQQHRPVADPLLATPCVLHVRHPGGMLTPPMHTFHRPAAPHRGTLTCTVAILGQGTHWAAAPCAGLCPRPINGGRHGPCSSHHAPPSSLCLAEHALGALHELAPGGLSRGSYYIDTCRHRSHFGSRYTWGDVQAFAHAPAIVAGMDPAALTIRLVSSRALAEHCDGCLD